MRRFQSNMQSLSIPLLLCFIIRLSTSFVSGTSSVSITPATLDSSVSVLVVHPGLSLDSNSGLRDITLSFANSTQYPYHRSDQETYVDSNAVLESSCVLQQLSETDSVNRTQSLASQDANTMTYHVTSDVYSPVAPSTQSYTLYITCTDIRSSRYAARAQDQALSIVLHGQTAGDTIIPLTPAILPAATSGWTDVCVSSRFYDHNQGLCVVEQTSNFFLKPTIMQVDGFLHRSHLPANHTSYRAMFPNALTTLRARIRVYRSLREYEVVQFAFNKTVEFNAQTPTECSIDQVHADNTTSFIPSKTRTQENSIHISLRKAINIAKNATPIEWANIMNNTVSTYHADLHITCNFIKLGKERDYNQHLHARLQGVHGGVAMHGSNFIAYVSGPQIEPDWSRVQSVLSLSGPALVNPQGAVLNADKNMPTKVNVNILQGEIAKSPLKGQRLVQILPKEYQTSTGEYPRCSKSSITFNAQLLPLVADTQRRKALVIYFHMDINSMIDIITCGNLQLVGATSSAVAQPQPPALYPVLSTNVLILDVDHAVILATDSIILLPAVLPEATIYDPAMTSLAVQHQHDFTTHGNTVLVVGRPTDRPVTVTFRMSDNSTAFCHFPDTTQIVYPNIDGLYILANLTYPDSTLVNCYHLGIMTDIEVERSPVRLQSTQGNVVHAQMTSPLIPSDDAQITVQLPRTCPHFPVNGLMELTFSDIVHNTTSCTLIMDGTSIPTTTIIQSNTIQVNYTGILHSALLSHEVNPFHFYDSGEVKNLTMPLQYKQPLLTCTVNSPRSVHIHPSMFIIRDRYVVLYRAGFVWTSSFVQSDVATLAKAVQSNPVAFHCDNCTVLGANTTLSSHFMMPVPVEPNDTLVLDMKTSGFRHQKQCTLHFPQSGLTTSPIDGDDKNCLVFKTTSQMTPSHTTAKVTIYDDNTATDQHVGTYTVEVSCGIATPPEYIYDSKALAFHLQDRQNRTVYKHAYKLTTNEELYPLEAIAWMLDTRLAQYMELPNPSRVNKYNLNLEVPFPLMNNLHCYWNDEEQPSNPASSSSTEIAIHIAHTNGMGSILLVCDGFESRPEEGEQFHGIVQAVGMNHNMTGENVAKASPVLQHTVITSSVSATLSIPMTSSTTNITFTLPAGSITIQVPVVALEIALPLDFHVSGTIINGVVQNMECTETDPGSVIYTRLLPDGKRVLDLTINQTDRVNEDITITCNHIRTSSYAIPDYTTTAYVSLLAQAGQQDYNVPLAIIPLVIPAITPDIFIADTVNTTLLVSNTYIDQLITLTYNITLQHGVAMNHYIDIAIPSTYQPNNQVVCHINTQSYVVNVTHSMITQTKTGTHYIFSMKILDNSQEQPNTAILIECSQIRTPMIPQPTSNAAENSISIKDTLSRPMYQIVHIEYPAIAGNLMLSNTISELLYHPTSLVTTLRIHIPDSTVTLPASSMLEIDLNNNEVAFTSSSVCSALDLASLTNLPVTTATMTSDSQHTLVSMNQLPRHKSLNITCTGLLLTGATIATPYITLHNYDPEKTYILTHAITTAKISAEDVTLSQPVNRVIARIFIQRKTYLAEAELQVYENFLSQHINLASDRSKLVSVKASAVSLVDVLLLPAYVNNMNITFLISSSSLTTSQLIGRTNDFLTNILKHDINAPRIFGIARATTSPYSQACFNTVKDGMESAVDCGGKGCPMCKDMQTCKVATDCLRNTCVDGTCSGALTTFSNALPNISSLDRLMQIGVAVAILVPTIRYAIRDNR